MIQVGCEPRAGRSVRQAARSRGTIGLFKDKQEILDTIFLERWGEFIGVVRLIAGILRDGQATANCAGISIRRSPAIELAIESAA